MELTNYSKEDILEKKVEIKISVKELIAIWGVFGEVTKEELIKRVKASGSVESDVLKFINKDITEEFTQKYSGINYDIYSDIKGILKEIGK